MLKPVAAWNMIKSPVGELAMVVDAGALTAILWENENLSHGRLAAALEDENHPLLTEAGRQ